MTKTLKGCHIIVNAVATMGSLIHCTKSEKVLVLKRLKIFKESSQKVINLHVSLRKKNPVTFIFIFFP